MKKKISLEKKYQSYMKKKKSKTDFLHSFRLAMPEIIFRTTKLEGESVTRRMINALFH